MSIHIIGPKSKGFNQFSTKYNKWYRDERASLFETLTFAQADIQPLEKSFPKLASSIELNILRKLMQGRRLSMFYNPRGTCIVNYSRKVGYFLQVLSFEPTVLNSSGQKRPPSEFKELRFNLAAYADIVLCSLNSNLFYWFITVTSDCRHLNKREIDNFPIDLTSISWQSESHEFSQLGQALMEDLQIHSEMRVMAFSHDTLQVQSIIPKYSKPIIDQIDSVLARHYGFSDEELDYIINYDIKYRMGDELFSEEEGEK